LKFSVLAQPRINSPSTGFRHTPTPILRAGDLRAARFTALFTVIERWDHEIAIMDRRFDL